MKAASIGVSAHLGWAATAILSLGRSGPQVLRSDRLATAPEEDREAKEPFHVAGGFEGLARVPRPENPQATLERGLAKQRRFTARELEKLASALAEASYEIATAGILVSRGRRAPSFEKSIGSHTQIHVEEGLAVRDSIARALLAAGARVRELDTKNLLEIASEELGESGSALMQRLGEVRPASGASWRKEEKQAALAAWIAFRSRHTG